MSVEDAARAGMTLASFSRSYVQSYVLGLLERDVAYDDDPVGKPPLRVADYWRALVAVLTVDPVPLRRAGGLVTGVEAMAFTRGYQSGLDGAVMAVGEAWRPGLLHRRPSTPVVSDGPSLEPSTPAIHRISTVRTGLSGTPPTAVDGNVMQGPAGRLLVLDGEGEVVAS
uniref:hypothetical protein n=1 Tax=Frankia sp. Cj3 TaxID=2880976 RepID=UPI001EF4B723